jgi:hypothetical protein
MCAVVPWRLTSARIRSTVRFGMPDSFTISSRDREDDIWTRICLESSERARPRGMLVTPLAGPDRLSHGL